MTSLLLWHDGDLLVCDWYGCIYRRFWNITFSSEWWSNFNAAKKCNWHLPCCPDVAANWRNSWRVFAFIRQGTDRHDSLGGGFITQKNYIDFNIELWWGLVCLSAAKLTEEKSNNSCVTKNKFFLHFSSQHQKAKGHWLRWLVCMSKERILFFTEDWWGGRNSA